MAVVINNGIRLWQILIGRGRNELASGTTGQVWQQKLGQMSTSIGINVATLPVMFQGNY